MAAILVYWVYGQASAAAIGFGGFVALANGGLLVWRMRAAKRCDDSDAQRALRMIYRTGLERFALVVFFLALGMGVLKLDPRVMIAGFVLGQLAWLIGVAIKPGRTH